MFEVKERVVRVNLNRAQYQGTVTYSDATHTHVKRDDGVKGMGIGGGWIEFTSWLDRLPALALLVCGCSFLPAKAPCRAEDAALLKDQCVAAAEACPPEPARCIELEVCEAKVEERTIKCLQ
jgi:hypothetical protein